MVGYTLKVRIRLCLERFRPLKLKDTVGVYNFCFDMNTIKSVSNNWRVYDSINSKLFCTVLMNNERKT